MPIDPASPHSHHAQKSSAFQTALAPIHPASQSVATYYQPLPYPTTTPPTPAPPPAIMRTCQPQLIATISAGFEKGDYLIREERGSNTYFDFFEEAYNFACQKGYTRMPGPEEADYMEIIKHAHRSVPGGCRFNTGRLLMVLRKKLVPLKATMEEEEEEPSGPVIDDEGGSLSYTKRSSDSSSSQSRGQERDRKKLALSTNTLPTDSESSAHPTAYSDASSSYIDSWE